MRKRLKKCLKKVGRCVTDFNRLENCIYFRFYFPFEMYGSSRLIGRELFLAITHSPKITGGVHLTGAFFIVP